ncbi:MAG: hypothetical protein M3P44_15370, partial [Actinomycetota bacterium]|nr:hypothetical protein [Actinomycetota bacterium]
MLALVALPALLTGYLSLKAGGFYPATPALVALVLGQVMVLRTTSAQRPYAGYSHALAIAGAALALFGLWGLSSSLWSHAPGRALMEFDRVLMYLLVLVVFGSMRWSDGQTRWMVRLLALAVVGVCGVALASRVLPDVLTTAPNVANNRLSYPLTYWNSLGLLAALGAVLCLYLASDERAGAWIRALAAAGTPVVITTLYFTFSRGAIAAGAIAIVLFALVGRPRGLLAALLALAVPVTVALVSAYRASLLAGLNPTSAAATRQGHHVAWVVGGCIVGAAALRLCLVPLDRRLAAIDLPALSRRTVGALAAAA